MDIGFLELYQHRLSITPAHGQLPRYLHFSELRGVDSNSLPNGGHTNHPYLVRTGEVKISPPNSTFPRRGYSVYLSQYLSI